MGFSPFLNASSTLRVVSAVRSSCTDSPVTRGERRAERKETHVEVVPDDEHGRVAARALALDLDDGELAVLGRLAGLDAAELGADGVEDVVRAAEHARRRGADLHEVFADGFSRLGIIEIGIVISIQSSVRKVIQVAVGRSTRSRSG